MHTKTHQTFKDKLLEREDVDQINFYRSFVKLPISEDLKQDNSELALVKKSVLNKSVDATESKFMRDYQNPMLNSVTLKYFLLLTYKCITIFKQKRKN